jgi:hypothetical protein
MVFIVQYMTSLYLESQPTYKYGGSYLLEAVQSFQQAEIAVANPRDELDQYLKSGVEQTEDAIKWWGVSLVSLLVLGRS